jgi:predicted RNase H-like nuclease (RuvC/YqgF family)
LKFISGVRDKSILSIYDTYKDYQIETSKKINEVIGKIDNQEDYIESIKEKYSSTKQKLSRERNPQGKLKFQKDKDYLESKIANEKSALTELKQELSALEKTKQANIGNWIKQIEIVDGIFELRKDAFEKNLTKRIRRTLNYADFICLIPEHSESVKKIMKGEYDVEEK